MSRTKTLIAAATAVWASSLGCAGSAEHTTAGATAWASSAPATGSSEARPSAEPERERTLPEAPWAAAPLRPEAAPEPLVQAWREAGNRDRCAPMAPRALGAGAGAEPRMGQLDGGWAVEYDRPGVAGVQQDGTPCKDCGRASFGVAGTAMTPQELADGAASDPANHFDDGSHAAFERAPEDEATAATITVAGQGCVYLVWSFLGEEHARQLVRELRFVAVRDRDGTADRVADLRSSFGR